MLRATNCATAGRRSNTRSFAFAARLGKFALTRADSLLKFADRVRELVANDPVLTALVGPLLTIITTMTVELARLTAFRLVRLQ